MEGIVSKCLKTKFAPFFFEVHTGCIIYDRINFKVCVCLVDGLHRRLSRGVADTLRGRVLTRTLKGSIALRGSDAAVEIKHSQGPLPRVLFEQTEGHIFWIQYRYVEVQLPEPVGLSVRSSLQFIVCNAHATILTNNDREGDLSSSLGGAGASPTATGDRREVPLLSLAGTRDRRRFPHTQTRLSVHLACSLSHVHVACCSVIQGRDDGLGTDHARAAEGQQAQATRQGQGRQ
jgi:hypothetical protein